MKIGKVHRVEFIRDGGSYSLRFDGDDGRPYALYLRTTRFESPSAQTHHAPILFRHDRNDDGLPLSWEDAQALVDEVVFDDPHFSELVAVLGRFGKKMQ